MKDLTAGQDVIDAAMAKLSWSRRNRPWIVGGAYAGFAALLAIAARMTGVEEFYKLVALMGEPMLSLALGTIGPWPALILGVIVNATAIGLVLQNMARFSIRMDGMGDLALRVLGRNKS